MEPNEDVHSLIKTLQKKSCSMGRPFVCTAYTCVAAEVRSMIKELERRNRIFEGVPSADSFIEPEGEKEIEVVEVRTDDELIAEVLREKMVERGEVGEMDDESEWEEDEPEMKVKEILASITRLRRAFLSRGEVCVRAAKVLALAQDEVAREEIQNA